MRKHFGWTGFGFYGDGLYRWNTTIGNAQYMIAAGFFQQIKGWELDLGYKHLQTLSGTTPAERAKQGHGMSEEYWKVYSGTESGVSAGRIRIPDASGPIPSSSSEQSMPSEASPRIFELLML